MAHDLESLHTKYLAQITQDAIAASTDAAAPGEPDAVGILLALSRHVAELEAHMTLLLDHVPGAREAISTQTPDDTAGDAP